MTATDELLVTGYPNSLRPELHKALKARGIDYWVAQGITFWNRDDGCECLAYGYKVNGVPKLAVKVVGFTDPEQAIAATLGDVLSLPYFWTHDGTLHIELPKLPESISVRLPDQRDREVGSARTWQYTLGGGTCKDVCNSVSEFTCSVCGFNCDLTSWISLFDGDDGRHRHHHHGTPNYCPNCGRRVVEVDK